MKVSKLFNCLNFVILFMFVTVCDAINCYECQSSQGQDCKFHGATCKYGMFGCIKITAYSGGVDKLGNFYNEDNSIIYAMRGCNILPIGGVDACQQQSLVGVRLVTCYCFSDYCNHSNSWKFSLIFLLPFLLFFR